MKKLFSIIALAAVLASCAPVLSRELMKQGSRDPSFSMMREGPDAFKGRLFILGGVIVGNRFTEAGSQIEALAAPVDSKGYLRDSDRSEGRFLAVYPRTKGLLDPMVYKKGREITLAGEFIGVRSGKIDEMEYDYPLFEIRQIYLWREERDYYRPGYPYYYDPFYYPSPFFDPWGRPYRTWPSPPWWY
jgi:outer membrane lipoprotein